MRVGVDLDGVLFDFHKSLTAYLASIDHEFEITHDPKDWYFYRQWGMSDEDFVKHCNEGVDAGYVFRGSVHQGGPESIRKIKDAGHSIHIITDRRFGCTPESSQRATREWLEEHRIPYDTLDFSADKTIVQTDVMVEDKIENYDKLMAAGTLVYLINRPWNMPAHDGRIRINDITEFAEMILTFDRLMARSV